MLNKKLKAKIIELYGCQADFAIELNIDESYISRIIHGRRHLSDEEKERWAKLLKCNMQDLFR